MRNLKIIIVFILAINLNSCYAQNDKSKKMVKELLESIYKNDSISSITYSKTPYFHCKLKNTSKEKLLFAEVVLVSESSQNFCYTLDINGITAYVYIENCNDKPNKSDPFFTIHANFRSFMIDSIEGNFIFYELKRYPNIHNKGKLDDSFKL